MCAYWKLIAEIIAFGYGEIFFSVFFSSAIGELFALLMCQIREGVRAFRTYQ